MRRRLSWLFIALAFLVLGGQAPPGQVFGPGPIPPYTQGADSPTFFVATTGSDSNACTVSGSPCLTIQHAYNLAVAKSHASAQINIADGTYTAGLNCTQPSPIASSGGVVLNGDSSTPANVLINTSAANNNAIVAQNGCRITLQFMELEANGSAGSDILASNNASVTIAGNVVFNAAQSMHMDVYEGAVVLINSNTTIVGGAQDHYHAHLGGLIVDQSNTVTITGTPNFSDFFAGVAGPGMLAVVGTTYSGSITGNSLLVHNAGFVDTGPFTACQSFFPGTAVTYSQNGIDPTTGGQCGTIATPNYANGGASMFGTGSTGAQTISSGTTTLTQDANYTNLTISGTGKLVTSGYTVYVNGTLDISAAPTLAIIPTATASTAGGNASGSSAGSGAAGVNAFTAGRGTGGASGAAGGTAGNPGTAGTSGAQLATFQDGGTDGGGGAGGASGVPHAGGTGALKQSLGTAGFLNVPNPVPGIAFGISGAAAITPIGGGTGGGSGGSGGADATNAGGGSGGGGLGSSNVRIFARYINRGGSTATSAIAAIGGAGGNGGNGVAGTAGGGGGGSGGGGGWVEIVVGNLLGSTCTNCLDASGGTGGTGGNSPATGAGGTGGNGGSSGNIQIVNLGAPTYSSSTNNVAGSSGSGPTGVTGGAGGAGATLQSNL